MKYLITPTKGLESRHNIIYWRGGDYIGIGPGAHGRLTSSGQRVATQTALAPKAWLDRVSVTSSGTVASQPLSRSDHANELIMMGLRMQMEFPCPELKRLLARLSRFRPTCLIWALLQ